MSSILLSSATSQADETPPAVQHSELWGKQGEKWDPAGRLPDYSFAGYQAGEQPIPTPEPTSSIREFGAVGDGVTDDTAAFRKAVANPQGGVISIPPGDYLLTDIIDIQHSNTILRGAGEEKTRLIFPRHLQEVRPNWSEDTAGNQTSVYSWLGGFLWVKGKMDTTPEVPVVKLAERGTQTVDVQGEHNIREGDWVRIKLTAIDKDFLEHIYQRDPGPHKRMFWNHSDYIFTFAFHSRVAAIKEKGAELVLERYLPFDLRPEWKPVISKFAPRVTNCGIENLTLTFPERKRVGHLKELGYNGIQLESVTNCWVRHVTIENCDSGVFIYGGSFNTVTDVTLNAGKTSEGGGHHALSVEYGASSNLFTNFDIQLTFIHDISQHNSSLNVFSNGRGIDLCFDMHKAAPFANLYTNLDLGRGTRPWKSGGGAGLGHHTAAWTTFWNLQASAQEPGHQLPVPQISYKVFEYAPAMTNFVGVNLTENEETAEKGWWIENIAPGKLQPQNLYEAQLNRRLAENK